MASFETNKVEYNNTTEYDLDVQGSVWFEVTSQQTMVMINLSQVESIKQL